MGGVIVGAAAIGLLMMFAYAVPFSDGGGILAGIVIAGVAYWCWDRWR